MTEADHVHDDLVREIGIPGAISGNRGLVGWLYSIQIRISLTRLARIRASTGAFHVAADGRKHPSYIYEQLDIKKIIKEVTGVSPRCWMAARREDRESGVILRMRAGAETKTELVNCVGVQGGSDHHSRDDSQLFAVVASLPYYGEMIKAQNRRFEYVVVLNKKAMVTTNEDMAALWDLSVVGYRARIMRYTALYQIAQPRTWTKPAGERKPKAGELSPALSLMVAYWMDPSDAKLKLCRVPSELFDLPEKHDVPAILSPLSAFRTAVEDFVKVKYPESWWWLWSGGHEVTPVTLDSVEAIRNRNGPVSDALDRAIDA